MSDQMALTAELTAAAFKGPAYAITNFTIHALSEDLMRLSFIEAPILNPELAQYRAAVVLDAEGAWNLAQLLLRFATPPKENAGG